VAPRELSPCRWRSFRVPHSLRPGSLRPVARVVTSAYATKAFTYSAGASAYSAEPPP
jgi:hypothetical protein